MPRKAKQCSYKYKDGKICDRRHVSKGYCGGHYARFKLKKDMDAPFREIVGKKMRLSIRAKRAAQTRWHNQVSADKGGWAEVTSKISETAGQKLEKLSTVTGLDMSRLAGRILENALKAL